MNKNKTNDKNRKLRREERNLAKNSFFTILQTYSAFFISILTSFLIARMITPEEWGYLILALSYISIFSTILIFFPPSLGISINYYVAKYSSKKRFKTLKSYLKYSLLFRIIFVLVIFLISIGIFFFASQIFILNLKEYSSLFLFLTPLILIDGINKILDDIYRGLNRFKFAFYTSITQNLIYIIGLFFFFIKGKFININHIALLLVISNVSSFILSLSFFCFLFLKINLRAKKESDHSNISISEVLKRNFKYGVPNSIKAFIDSSSNEVRLQIIGLLETPSTVTGFNISKNYRDFSGRITSSLTKPITINFIKLYHEKKFNELEKLYKKLLKYLLFISLIISGILFFLSDFFLLFIYGEDYLYFSIYLKLMSVAIIFNTQNTFFVSLIRAQNKLKLLIPIHILLVLIDFFLFIILLNFYGIIGGLIGLIIFYFTRFIIYTLLIANLFSIKPDIQKTMLQYIFFFISLFIVLYLNLIFLTELNQKILSILNLSFFDIFNIFSLILFLILFLMFNIFFKIITKRDVEIIEDLLHKDNLFFKILKYILNLFKKFLR